MSSAEDSPLGGELPSGGRSEGGGELCRWGEEQKLALTPSTSTPAWLKLLLPEVAAVGCSAIELLTEDRGGACGTQHGVFEGDHTYHGRAEAAAAKAAAAEAAEFTGPPMTPHR